MVRSFDPPPAAEAPSKPPAEAPPNVGPSVAQAPADQAAQGPACDYQACARAYESFRASDCTYQPYGGASRQRCDKNASQQVDATPLAPNSRVQSLLDQMMPKAQCNIDVCTRFYESFNPADCTYQPHGGGPRRVCTR